MEAMERGTRDFGDGAFTPSRGGERRVGKIVAPEPRRELKWKDEKPSEFDTLKNKMMMIGNGW